MNAEFEAFVAERGAAVHLGAAGFAGLIHAWERTVQDLTEGRKIDNDDFLNDLDVRTLVGDFLVGHAGQPLSIIERLQTADDKFKRLTREADVCAWGAGNEMKYGYAAGTHWWLYRTRKTLTEDPRD